MLDGTLLQQRSQRFRQLRGLHSHSATGLQQQGDLAGSHGAPTDHQAAAPANREKNG